MTRAPLVEKTNPPRPAVAGAPEPLTPDTSVSPPLSQIEGEEREGRRLRYTTPPLARPLAGFKTGLGAGWGINPPQSAGWRTFPSLLKGGENVKGVWLYAPTSMADG